MMLTSFVQISWWFILMHMFIGRVLCQEGAPCSQQIIDEVTAILEEKFLDIGKRLSRMEGALGGVSHLDEKFLDMGNQLLGVEGTLGGMGNRLLGVEGALAGVALMGNRLLGLESAWGGVAPLDERFQNVGNQLSGVEGTLGGMGTRLSRLEGTLGGVEAELISIKVMTENIETEAVALGEMSSQNQIMKEEIFSNLDDIKGDIMQETQKLKLQVSSVEDNLREALNDKTTLTQKVFHNSSDKDINKTVETCPVSEGFFVAPGGDQCLKFFSDAWRNWTQADTKCKSLGLALAKPDDAIEVRKYIVENTNVGSWTWVGAQTDGSYMRWVLDQSTHFSLAPDDDAGSDYCLALMTTDYRLKYEPDEPYTTDACSTKRWTLCEKIRE